MTLSGALALVTILEMPSSCVDFLKSDYNSAISGLSEFKKRVNKQRRHLATKYHPDLPSGDAKIMKKVNAAADILLLIKIERPQPQPRMIVVRWGQGYMAGTTNTATGCW